jgi:hypothetical protein
MECLAMRRTEEVPEPNIFINKTTIYSQNLYVLEFL